MRPLVGKMAADGRGGLPRGPLFLPQTLHLPPGTLMNSCTKVSSVSGAKLTRRLSLALRLGC